MLSKMVYGPFIGIIQNYFNGILHLLDINRIIIIYIYIAQTSV